MIEGPDNSFAMSLERDDPFSFFIHSTETLQANWLKFLRDKIPWMSFYRLQNPLQVCEVDLGESKLCREKS